MEFESQQWKLTELIHSNLCLEGSSYEMLTNKGCETLEMEIIWLSASFQQTNINLAFMR